MARFEITAPLFISEPVAGRVITLAKGSVPFSRLGFKTSSQASASITAAAAISLVPSSTLPPPTARMNSIFSFLQISTALRRVSTFGFGSMPQNSMWSNSCRAVFTWSYTPLFFTLPPPKVTRMRLPRGNSLLSLPICPLPKISLVVF